MGRDIDPDGPLAMLVCGEYGESRICGDEHGRGGGVGEQRGSGARREGGSVTRGSRFMAGILARAGIGSPDDASRGGVPHRSEEGGDV